MKLASARLSRITCALVIAIFAAGWITWAQVGSTGIIYGCVNNAGQIRGIDETTGSCRNGDQTLAWYTKQGAEAMFLGRSATAANANTLDGLDSTAFALSSHNHDDRYVTVDGAGNYLPLDGKAADADLLDGLDSTQFVRASDLAALAARVAAIEAGGGDDGDPPTCPSDPACNVDPLDVVFLVDTTGNMAGAINNLKSSLGTFITTLTNQHANTAFAVAEFRDFPTAPFGSPTGPPVSDEPFELRVSLTTNVNAVTSGVNALQPRNGGDSLESGHEALYQVATGEGILEGGANVPPSNIGFRTGSKRVVMVITSAGFHAESDYPFSTHGAAAAIQALNAVNAKVVGLAGVEPGLPARAVLQSYAVQTGAVVPPSAFGLTTTCATGQNGAQMPALADGMCPLVFEISSLGTGLNAAILTAVLLVP